MRTTTLSFFFFFNDTATTEIYTLSLHDALPICARRIRPHEPHVTLAGRKARQHPGDSRMPDRSEEHTSELQSPCNLVCRLLLEKKKMQETRNTRYFIFPAQGTVLVALLTEAPYT